MIKFIVVKNHNTVHHRTWCRIDCVNKNNDYLFTLENDLCLHDAERKVKYYNKLQQE